MDKFQICSAACVKLDRGLVQSFSEISKEAEVSGSLYDITRQTLLLIHYWNFNTKTVELTQDAQAPSDPNYKHAFIPPSDSLRYVSFMTLDGTSVITTRDEGGRIFSNEQRLLCKYQRDADEADFPAYFTKALIANPSHEFAEPLVGTQESKNSTLQDYQMQLATAITTDANNNPPKIFMKKRNSPWQRRKLV